MTPPRHDGGAARLSDHDLEAMLARAAEEGARRALRRRARRQGRRADHPRHALLIISSPTHPLSDIPLRRRLGGKDAVLTIHDMRSLLECIQFVRRTAVQTAVHVITTGVLIALLVGIAMKLRWFGPNP